MGRTTVVVAVAIAITTLYNSAPHSPAQIPAGRTANAPVNVGPERRAALEPREANRGEMSGRRAAINIAWSNSDARQKVASFLSSHHAHREAILSLQQCHTCHGTADAWALDHAAMAALQPKRPWIGISVAPADEILRSQLRLPDGAGVVVTQVVPDGPAQQAGVEANDVLLSVDGKPVAGSDDLDQILGSADPDGPPVTLKLMQAGERVDKKVTPRKPDAQLFVDALGTASRSAFRLGIRVTNPDQTLRRQLKLGDTGLVVSEVNAGSPAESAGLKAGDILLSVTGEQLAKQEELTDAVHRAAGTPVELGVMRGGSKRSIKVTPTNEPVGASPTANRQMSMPVSESTRELVLVHPHAAQVLTGDGLAGVSHPVISTQPLAPPDPDRLAQIAEKLDELRQTVDALRRDLEEHRGRVAKSAKR